MEAWLVRVAPVAVVGLLYVVLPVVAHAYSRFRGPKVVTCPETNTPVEIELDAAQAAATAAVGPPDLRVRDCMRWPERRHCHQECLQQLA